MIRNYQFKMVIAFYILSSLIVSILGIIMASNISGYEQEIFKYTGLALILLAITCITMLSIISKKVIEPMSRMLKSANPYTDDSEIENTIDEDVEIKEILRTKLKNAQVDKREKDTILKHLTDGVISFDMAGNVKYINPAAKRMLELDDDEITFDKIFGDYEDINMEKLIYLEHLTSPEKQIDNKQGTIKLLFVPFKDEINRPAGLMAVAQDITEHVELDNMRKEFIADVSHELKTPLTSIKGFSETLLDDDGIDKETQKHFLKIIIDNADRMENTVKDLLILSRYDKTKTKTVFTKFDLVKMAKECQEKFEIEVKKKNQTMRCYNTSEVPLVYADKDGIERVILNIVSNSVKYTQENGTIDIYVGRLRGDAYIKIKDNGIGIPEEDLDKVYDRFYRVDKARSRQSGGTGLGLSIAKQIIEKNNGSINISSKLGEGTEVTLRIPVEKK